MKGHVLDFSIQNNRGVITTPNEQRYTFQGQQWKEQQHPTRGQHVDFEVDDNTQEAINIYFALAQDTPSTATTTSTPKATVSNSSTTASDQTKQAVPQDHKAKITSILDDYQHAVFTCFKKAFNIKGRAARPEYWYFQLCSTLLFMFTNYISETFFNIALIIFMAPLITVTVRRLHDINRSGWWALLLLIPLVGSLVIFYWAASKGSTEENLYGPPPQ